MFHIKPYAGFLIFVVTLAWMWTWGVIRGVGRVAVAAVVGEWYFHRYVTYESQLTPATRQSTPWRSLQPLCTGHQDRLSAVSALAPSSWRLFGLLGGRQPS